MRAAICQHAASGCDYPASECSGKCALGAAPKQSAARHCECEEPGHIAAGLICMTCGGKVGHNHAPTEGAQAHENSLADDLDDLASDMGYEANCEMDQEKASRALLIEKAAMALRKKSSTTTEGAGRSLRDYFAARTLPACIAVASEAIAAGRIKMSDEQAADFRRAICIDAWGWADEMLATRGKQS